MLAPKRDRDLKFEILSEYFDFEDGFQKPVDPHEQDRNRDNSPYQDLLPRNRRQHNNGNNGDYS